MALSKVSEQKQKRNQRSFIRVAFVAIAMFGFGYLLVPLYDIVCELTGLNGKTGQITEAEIAASFKPDLERTVEVQFVANNNVGMPWDFIPSAVTMKIHPGQMYGTYFTAKNPTARNMVGQAVPSVAPNKAGRYFQKTECFCFNQQPLAAGEVKQMPLRFIVDPRLPKDVKTLTLSYTLFDVSAKVAAN